MTETQVCLTPKLAFSFPFSILFVHMIVRDTTKVGKWATEMVVGARGEGGVGDA